MQNNGAMALHVDEELDDEYEYVERDVMKNIFDDKRELNAVVESLRKDLEIIAALEDFTNELFTTKYVTESQLKKYDSIVNSSKITDITGINYSSISLESFDTLINTVSAVNKAASNVSEKALAAAKAVKEGALATAEFVKRIQEQISSNITRIASSWDMVCGIIEKRWLGLKQLTDVYEMQHAKMYDKFKEVESNSFAFFKVKLYAAKLRNDGRNIHKKETLIEAIENDCEGLYILGKTFVETTKEFRRLDANTKNALQLKQPYKATLVDGTNSLNSIVKQFVTNNPVFTQGGFIKDYQAQSRVLLGGKVIFVNYNEEDIVPGTVRKDVRSFISRIGFRSVNKRDGNNNTTELVEVSNLSHNEAESIFTAVGKTNEILRYYHDSNVPKMLKERQSITTLITFATGLTGGNGVFDTIKRFFNNEDNLKAFNLVAPVAISKLLGAFLGASTFAVFSGIVAAAAAATLIEYLRKYIISNLFSIMDLQYKITDIIENFDHDFIDTLIDVHNQGYRVCKKLASTRNWS